MQLKKSALLCAAAFTVMSGSAMATAFDTDTAAQDLLNNPSNGAVTTGHVVFISGASAVQKGFVTMIEAMFDGAQPIKYFSKASSKGSATDKADYVAVAGTLKAGHGAWSNTKTVIVYRVTGGSVYGVNSVARGDTIDKLDVTSTACGSSGTGTAADPYQCTLTTGIPDAGVSDVAPVLFKSPVNTEGEVAAEALSEAELSNFASITPIYGLAFGVPVTSNVGSSVKFNRATVAAIMTGNVGTWDAVDGTESGDIVICRRTPGSGTQAVMNLWAGNYPCSADAQRPADRDASGAWDEASKTFTVANGAGGLIVVENASSDDVVSCLDKAVAGGTYTTKDRSGAKVTVDFDNGGYKAIGVLSMDSLAKSKAAGNWQFRSLDGAGKITWDNTAIAPVTTGTGKFPTKEAYENGDWDLQGWESFNIPTRTTGAKLQLLNKFVEKAGDPATLASVSALKNVAMAIPGGVHSGPQVLDAEYLNGNQCAPYNRNYND
ncbi:MAG: hypothetical protein CVU24_14905 [Betaproteobacteria bacterium HGW-Betaproteobacteria-18]|jgi:hypothetical protein|nr:MAG: hypothetical protein CVU33_17835 [Betaproteobacteria bacterium HGW-Betaproteobacteria-6]PKO59636.1 MAG: hypothetical protein CVU24_14905 [Betaproteobacteria bacterium HGW-Betaproteobacteria-18]